MQYVGLLGTGCAVYRIEVGRCVDKRWVDIDSKPDRRWSITGRRPAGAVVYMYTTHSICLAADAAEKEEKEVLRLKISRERFFFCLVWFGSPCCRTFLCSWKQRQQQQLKGPWEPPCLLTYCASSCCSYSPFFSFSLFFFFLHGHHQLAIATIAGAHVRWHKFRSQKGKKNKNGEYRYNNNIHSFCNIKTHQMKCTAYRNGTHKQKYACLYVRAYNLDHLNESKRAIIITTPCVLHCSLYQPPFLLFFWRGIKTFKRLFRPAKVKTFFFLFHFLPSILLVTHRQAARETGKTREFFLIIILRIDGNMIWVKRSRGTCRKRNAT